MKHRGCGGNVVPDPSVLYHWDSWNDEVDPPRADEHVTCALRCDKCGKEILGDPEIVLEAEEELNV